MKYSCLLSDKSICTKSRYKHFKSISHKSHEKSIIKRYIILHPIFHEVCSILRRYIKKHNEKHVEFDVRCVLKLLTTTTRVGCIKGNPKSNLEFSFKLSENLILSRKNQDRYYFSEIIEMRVSFIDSTGDMTYDYHPKQSNSMCEIKLNATIPRNPKLILC